MAQAYRKKEFIPDRDERGNIIMTLPFLKDLCENNQGYSTPYLNDTLYLGYKGFAKIQNLEEFKNVKCLYLENNGFQEISGFEGLPKLRMIYMQQNLLKDIEGLCHLKKLAKLNLSHNMISEIRGLKGLDELQTLEISHNLIQTTANCQELVELPSLRHLDMKNNKLEDKNEILPFFTQLKELTILYLQNNPAVRQVSQYRKTLTAELPNLSQLDDRPVSELEHTLGKAFIKGGREEETRVRTGIAEAKLSKAKADRAENAKRCETARANNKIEMRQMLDNLKVQKQDLVEKRLELTKEIKQYKSGQTEYYKVADSIRYCDQELTAEWYKMLEQNEASNAPSVPTISFDDDKDRRILAEEKKRDDEEIA